jgi:hypothetical protein
MHYDGVFDNYDYFETYSGSGYALGVSVAVSVLAH